MSIIDRVLKVMQEKGVSKVELLEKTKLTKSMLYYLFGEKINEDKIKLETLRAVATALGTTLDYLICGEEKEKPAQCIENADFQTQRRLLSELIEKITVYADKSIDIKWLF